jgi:hypothetical protein
MSCPLSAVPMSSAAYYTRRSRVFEVYVHTAPSPAPHSLRRCPLTLCVHRPSVLRCWCCAVTRCV